MLHTKSFNKCTLIGRCGNDLELRYTKKGVPVSNLILTTQDVWKNRETSQLEKSNKAHKVVIWGKLAERAVKFAKKGCILLVEGPLIYRDHVTKEGNKVTITEIKAVKIQKLNDPPQHFRTDNDESSDSDYYPYENSNSDNEVNYAAA